MSVTPATYTPDSAVTAALISRVTQLVDGTGTEARNCFSGSVMAYGNDIPNKAVFSTADGGLPTRPIKDANVTFTQERHPRVDINIRGDVDSVPGAFRDGQILAREVFEAMAYRPPTGYCECEALNSEPSYLGIGEDGQHEWLVSLQLTVDVIVTLIP